MSRSPGFQRILESRDYEPTTNSGKYLTFGVVPFGHTPMTNTEFVTVAKVGSIPEGSAESYVVGDDVVAVFHYEGEYYAINDMCPHMGASLATGHIEDGIVTCPWHAWRFKICDGTWCDNPQIKTDAYEVRIEGDEIKVRPKASV